MIDTSVDVVRILQAPYISLGRIIVVENGIVFVNTATHAEDAGTGCQHGVDLVGVFGVFGILKLVLDDFPKRIRHQRLVLE